MLPNLVIIGAAKSGTTSLHSYLDKHPDIAMSRLKELKFFLRDDWRDNVDWYARQFDDAPVRGESSPNYSMHPFLPSAAEPMSEVLPDAKLIYILRDPVDRVVANYVEHVHLGFESRPIGATLDNVEDPAHPYVCPSRYASQLQRFLACFPGEQILVVDHADLLHHRDDTMARVFRFLEVDDTFRTPDFEEELNTRSEKRRYGRLGRWMIRRNLMTREREFFRHGTPIRPVRRFLARPIDSDLSEADRQKLTAALAPEVIALRELTGQPWASWVHFPPGTGSER
jgi:hypothetical protein